MEKIYAPDGLPDDGESFRIGDDYMEVSQYYEHEGVVYLEAEEQGLLAAGVDEIPLFLLRVVDGKLERVPKEEASELWDLIEDAEDADDYL